MKRTLILTILKTKSSYQQNREEKSQPGEPSDTVQWWIGEDGAWRISTFILDHDIHVYKVEPNSAKHFIDNTVKHYGDVIERIVTLNFNDYQNKEEVEGVLKKAGLNGAQLEVAKAGFAFWNPDGERYHTQSQPRK